jgi:hypothetical protein
MDFGLAFSFPFQDEDWIKEILIGGVLVLTGIGFIPVAGWGLEVARRVIRGEEPTLPEWSEFGTLIVDGLKLIAIGVVWSIPIIVISFCLTAISVATGGASFDPYSYYSAPSALSGIFGVLNACISAPYALVISFLIPPAYGILAETGELGQALNPANAFRLLRENIGSYLIAWFVGGIAMSLLPAVGSIACGIGALPAVAYAAAVVGHLYGQAYRLAT